MVAALGVEVAGKSAAVVDAMAVSKHANAAASTAASTDGSVDASSDCSFIVDFSEDEDEEQQEKNPSGTEAQPDPLMANIGSVLAQIGGGMAGASMTSLMQPRIPAMTPAPMSSPQLQGFPQMPQMPQLSFGGY